METRDPKTYSIIGAAMEVHRTLGSGFLEAVYQEALAVELSLREIPFERERTMAISYKGVLLNCGYRTDFICFDEVIVEIKALNRLSGTEEAQVLNYLKASRFQTALLINFGAPSLENRRFALSV